MNPKHNVRLQDITLRDLMAIGAMIGLLAQEGPLLSRHDEEVASTHEDLADEAYLIADSLLARKDA